MVNFLIIICTTYIGLNRPAYLLYHYVSVNQFLTYQELFDGKFRID